MNKNYEVLNELVTKTQELHRAIFDKGYEQGQRDVLNEIRAEIKEFADILCSGDRNVYYVLHIIDKYKAEEHEN